MGRERQQYSGDVSHIHIAMRYALGDKLLCERFIQTYMTGMTDEGLFMDSWPGVDRVKRLTHRQIGLTFWGNIVDHSIQFVFDCYKYYLSSGNLECLRAPMKAFKKWCILLWKPAETDCFRQITGITDLFGWIMMHIAGRIIKSKSVRLIFIWQACWKMLIFLCAEHLCMMSNI